MIADEMNVERMKAEEVARIEARKEAEAKIELDRMLVSETKMLQVRKNKIRYTLVFYYINPMKLIFSSLFSTNKIVFLEIIFFYMIIILPTSKYNYYY